MAENIRNMRENMPLLGGRFLGQLSEDHPYANPFNAPSEALHRDNLNGMTPEEFMKRRPDDEEGFFLPGSDLLWIHKRMKDYDAPMSSLDPETSHV